jgi:O-antigen/teichoic acid export membrane protein
MSSKLPFKRAFAAIGGSAGMALTSLVLALCLMQKGSVEEYGLFAFLLVTQALANGVSNAVLGAPLLIALNDNSKERADRVLSFMSANLIICLIFSGIQSFFAFYYSGSTVVSLVYACSAFSTTLRWFGRSYCNNNHQHSKVVVSDAVYSLLSLCGAVILFFVDMVSLASFGALTALIAIFATPLLGGEYLKKQFLNIFSSRLTGFFEGYKHQGKYALIGVLSTEATANAHSYLVTLMLGPKAFAPLAAAMLLFRPVNVVYSSLMQIERPRLRQLISNDKQQEAKKSLRRFFYLNILSWLANLILVIVVLKFFGDLYWNDTATFNILETAAYILALITFCRAFKIPISVLIQAFDRFKSLSTITLKSCIVSLPLVYLSILYLDQSISLLGVLVGDMLALLLLIRLYLKGAANNA